MVTYYENLLERTGLDLSQRRLQKSTRGMVRSLLVGNAYNNSQVTGTFAEFLRWRVF